MKISIETGLVALLIIDMQNGVVTNAYNRDVVIANINELIERARRNQIPIVWVQHSDEQLQINSNEWLIVPELKPRENEIIINKKYGDAFEDTLLENKLKEIGIKKVFVTGAQTEACIRATLHGSFVRGFDTVLISDAHTTEDYTSFGLPSPEVIINFTNTYWTWQSAPGRQGAVLKTDEIIF